MVSQPESLKYPIEDLKKTTNGYHHGMLSCKIAGLQIYNIHLHPGHWEIRHREVDLLIKTLKKHKPNEPILLVGDFNTFSKHDEKYYDQTPDIIPFFVGLIKDGRATETSVMISSTIHI